MPTTTNVTTPTTNVAVKDDGLQIESDKRGEDSRGPGDIGDGLFTDDPGSSIKAANSTFDMNTSTPPVNSDDIGGGLESFGVTPQIVWKGDNVPNFWQGRNGLKPLAIVNHIMQSTLNSAASWFQNPNAEASSHFGLGKDGRIWQFVRVENSAWANGPVNKPDLSVPWLAEIVRNGINPNRVTISIEHEGNTGEPFTEEMYQSTLWLHRYLISNFGIPADRQHIIGHYQIDLVNRPSCPGKGFPWDRLMKDLGVSTTNTDAQPAVAAATADVSTDVSGRVEASFGPGTVNSNGSYVRVKPGFGPDATVLRRVNKGTVMKFIAYSDAGPAYQGGNRWYQVSPDDGGGWIHSMLIS